MLDRLHREFFRPIRSASRLAAWEPPVDILETEREVLVLVALPAVRADRVEVAIDGDELVVAGIRVLPSELRTAVIHRLEAAATRRAARRWSAPTAARAPVRRYEVKPSAKVDHVHLFVDGDEAAMMHKLKGSFKLGPLKPGERKVCVSPVNKNIPRLGRKPTSW
ncbi:MAG: hypothetical protein WBW81_13575 [Methylocella sp.]